MTTISIVPCNELPDFEPEDYLIRSTPLDPNFVSIALRDYRVYQLLDKLQDKSLVTHQIQRKHIWNNQAKSSLIESALVNIPLPDFYIDATDDNQWLTIDGNQRLLTFYDFVIKQNFSLEGLDFLTNLEGKTFSELTLAWQRRIREKKLKIHVLLRGTSSENALNIARRIKTATLPMSCQEFRYIKYQ
jgi:hypothetical protein